MADTREFSSSMSTPQSGSANLNITVNGATTNYNPFGPNLSVTIPTVQIFVATFGVTTFSELEAAYADGKMLIAYHDDQELLLKKKTSTQFIFSGLNSRSWMGQDSDLPCTSELVCTSSGWSHNWKPLSNVIRCESYFYIDSTGVLTVGTHTDSATVGETLSGYIDNILSAGLVPTLRYWDGYMHKEMYLPLHSRGCCGYFFQHYGTRTYHIYIGRYTNDTTGAAGYTIALEEGPVPNT